MNKFLKKHNRLIAKEMVEILKKKSYDAHYKDNLVEAKNMILEMIPKGSSIALGGSETLSDMDMINTIRNGNYNFFDRYQDIPFPETVEIYRQSLLADYLITGTNAITRNGELVNIDCSGNRVAGMIFGPKRVIVVAGTNKIVDTLEDALKRLKKIAPLNCERIGHETPCRITGRCMDCQIPDRMCNSIGIINHGMKFEGRITIIMVGEEAGF